MSKENAVPEVDTGAHEEEEEVDTTEVGESVTASSTSAPVASAETSGVVADASSPTDLASRIAALEPAAQAVLKDVLTYISVGFNDYSLMIGVLRLAEMLK